MLVVKREIPIVLVKIMLSPKVVFLALYFLLAVEAELIDLNLLNKTKVWAVFLLEDHGNVT